MSEVKSLLHKLEEIQPNDELNQIKLNNNGKAITAFMWELEDRMGNLDTLLLWVRFDVNAETLTSEYHQRRHGIDEPSGIGIVIDRVTRKMLPRFAIKTNPQIRASLVKARDKGKEIIKLYRGLDKEVKKAVNAGSHSVIKGVVWKNFM